LFQRFYRSDAGRDRDSGGTGLGLSLCREIVAAQGGQIELTRAEDDWTEFTVRLPRLADET
jgi:signal transduction histidine kinase